MRRLHLQLYRTAKRTRFEGNPDRDELIEIGRLIDSGKVHPHIAAVLELEKGAEAQVQLERHHAQGKVVLRMG
jgi:NADPH:quinone reductase-like Zn-dependent oxidoreductase